MDHFFVSDLCDFHRHVDWVNTSMIVASGSTYQVA